jgi:hypothetical protein
MPRTSVARGAIGRSSYEAVRKHIEQGKRATEAFALVAEASGRSKATVQTAYYRIARSPARRRWREAAAASQAGARREAWFE